MKGHHEGRGWRETLRVEATTMSNTGSSLDSGSNGSAATGATVRAWDPYEVWLKRVKQPRDQRIATANR